MEPTCTGLTISQTRTALAHSISYPSLWITSVSQACRNLNLMLKKTMEDMSNALDYDSIDSFYLKLL